MTWKKLAVIPAIALALTASGAAQANNNLVTNGGFELTTNGGGQLGFNTDATGWSVPSPNFPTYGSYAFLFTPGSADTTGVTGQYTNFQLWGPNNGSANGLPATSPDGGNFVASDGAANFQPGAISQTITGLTAGDTYKVGFYWAGAQQYLFSDLPNLPNQEQWQVSFGSQTQDTSLLTNANHGFTGWQYRAFNFTADSTSDVLSFLAISPDLAGVPPFVLLDGVSVTAETPEPTVLTGVVSGLLCLGVIGMVWRAKSAAARSTPASV